MNDADLNEMEIASSSVVRAAGRNFGAALAETSQFKTFQNAYETLHNDVAAQKALLAYQNMVKALRPLLMLNAASQAECAELERLKNNYLAYPSVQTYAQAESELAALCQYTASMISAAIGLNYAAACGASCCG